MDQNVIEYEKKLSDFERMFLFINDDLDFNKLSEMAQQIENYNKKGNDDRSPSTESSTDAPIKTLRIRDTYGFIQQSYEQEESLDDDWDSRIQDRREEENSQVSYKKQPKLGAPIEESKRQSKPPKLTKYGSYRKGSVHVMLENQQPSARSNQAQEEAENT